MIKQLLSDSEEATATYEFGADASRVGLLDAFKLIERLVDQVDTLVTEVDDLRRKCSE